MLYIKLYKNNLYKWLNVLQGHLTNLNNIQEG